MPKQIKDARQKLLDEGRKELTSVGYRGLNMRLVASNCGLAVGSVYNYFPSKEKLISTIMLEDWNKRMHNVTTECDRSPDVITGLGGLFRAIASFSDDYRDIWGQYAELSRPSPQNNTYHTALINELCRVIEPLLWRFKPLFCENLSVFLAETILHFAAEKRASFEELTPIFNKILS